MLGTPKEEAEKYRTLQTKRQALRTRQENDFKLYRLDKFEMPKQEGKWESFTTNRAGTDADQVINTLADGKVKIFIPIGDESEEERENLSLTEKFVYGALALRDSIAITMPEVLPLQAAMSWYTAIRGWLVLRAYLYEDDDGLVIPDIATWDILHTQWISGGKGLLWVATERYTTPEDVKDQYGITATPDEKGRAKVLDVWDSDEEGVIINGGYADKKKHGLKHPPVLVLPSGSTPLIQSDSHTDTIRDVGESCFRNNRHLFPIESRLGSYYMTIAGRVAKTPMAHYYDSSKGQAPQLDRSPFEKGAEIPLDIAMGEKMEPLTPPELTRDVFAFWEYLQGRMSVGGRPPISYGQINQALPAAGISILTHSAMRDILVFKRQMEQAYEWLAHELVSQYKSGDFGEMKLRGIDGSNRRFEIKVKPDQIDDSWNFEAELTADMPQDELSNMGMAVQAVEAELLSRQTARDRYKLADDTDLEQHIIDREKAFRLGSITLRKVAADLIEKYGDEEAAGYIMDAIQEIQGMQEKGVASQARTRTPVRPSGTTTAATPTPPESATGRPNALRRFMSRFGAGQ